MKREIRTFFHAFPSQVQELTQLVGTRHIKASKDVSPRGRVWVSIKCDRAMWDDVSDKVLSVTDTAPPLVDEYVSFSKSEIAAAELCVFAPTYAPIENVGPKTGFDLRRSPEPGLPTPWCWSTGPTVGRRPSAFPDQRRCMLWTYCYQVVVSDLLIAELDGCDLSAVEFEPMHDLKKGQRLPWSLLRGTRTASLSLDKCEGTKVQGHIITQDPPITVVARARMPAQLLAVDRSSVETPAGTIPDLIFTRELTPDLPYEMAGNLIPPQPTLLVADRVRRVLQKYMKSRAKLEPVTLV